MKTIHIVSVFNDMNKMVTIYVLYLTDNKYYVGKTKETLAIHESYEGIDIRMMGTRVKKHFRGDGSMWTRRYPPLKVFAVYPNCIDEDEDKYTKLYMRLYGIQNVRGGNYCQVELDELQIYILKREICGNSDRCYRCHGTGHFAKDCTNFFDYSTSSDKEIDSSVVVVKEVAGWLLHSLACNTRELRDFGYMWYDSMKSIFST